MFKHPNTIEEYYQIFTYGIVYYILFYIIINSDMIHDNFFNNFLRDYILPIMVLDGGYLIYKYISLKQKLETSNNIAKEKDDDTESTISEKIDLELDTENDIKISHHSSDTSSLLMSDIAI